MLLAEDDAELVLKATSGVRPEGAALEIGLEGAPVGGRGVYADLGGSPYNLPALRAAGIRSLVTAPFVVDGRVIGLLIVASRGADHFGEDDVERLQQIADRQAAAIERARLMELERARRGWLGFLAEASTMLAGTLDQQMTMALVAQLIVPRLATWCALFTVRDTDLAELAYAWHADETTTGTALYAVDVQAGWAGTKPAIVATIANNAELSILAVEVSGLLAGSTLAMLDGGALAASGTANCKAASANPAYSSTAANEMTVSVYGDDGGPLTFTAPWGSTSANLDPNSVNSNSFSDIGLAYRNSVNGPEATAWALSGTATPSIVLLTAFKLGAGGGAAASIPVQQTRPGLSRLHHHQGVRRQQQYWVPGIAEVDADAGPGAGTLAVATAVGTPTVAGGADAGPGAGTLAVTTSVGTPVVAGGAGVSPATLAITTAVSTGGRCWWRGCRSWRRNPRDYHVGTCTYSRK